MNTQNQTVIQDEEIELFGYSRRDAIEDGVLVDVTEAARTRGFLYPVAMTCAAFADCVQWTEETAARKDCVQDESGRLHDVLWNAFLCIRAQSRRGAPEVLFTTYRVPVEGKGVTPRKTTLKIVVHGGDLGEPVMTIMLPEED